MKEVFQAWSEAREEPRGEARGAVAGATRVEGEG